MNSLLSSLEDAAKNEGFIAVGAVNIEDALATVQFNNDLEFFKEWLKQGHQGEMQYLERNISKRADPRNIFSKAECVFCVVFPYAPAHSEQVLDGRFLGQPLFASYLYSSDYHNDVKQRLDRALKAVKASSCDSLEWQVCVDTKPILEKTWHSLAGTGYIGKNGLLITEKHGSYVILGEALINQKVSQKPISKIGGCGSCSLCVKHCPARVLADERQFIARRCTSYLTLETKAAAEGCYDKTGAWIAGCDVCQLVCPKNSNIEKNEKQRKSSWLELLQEREKDYQERASGSALGRIDYVRHSRNLAHAVLNKVDLLKSKDISAAVRLRRDCETDPNNRELWNNCLKELE